MKEHEKINYVEMLGGPILLDEDKLLFSIVTVKKSGMTRVIGISLNYISVSIPRLNSAMEYVMNAIIKKKRSLTRNIATNEFA